MALSRSDLSWGLHEDLLFEDNSRIVYNDMEELMFSIVENGVKNSLTAFLRKGNTAHTIKDGHRRYKAIGMAIERGLINPKEFKIPFMRIRAESSEDLLLGHIIQNTGQPLTLIEEAIVYDKLSKYGMQQAEMVKKTGKSAAHISNCFLLLTASSNLRKMIIDNKVSASLVITMLKKKSPSDVEAELNEAFTNKVADIASKNETRSTNDNDGMYDLPFREDNTKTTGASGIDAQLSDSSKPVKVKITAKNLNKEPKAKTYTKEHIMDLLGGLNGNDYDFDAIFSFLDENLK